MGYRMPRTPIPDDTDFTRLCAGDWWYSPYYLNEDGSRATYLGRYYYDHNAHRPPITVVLPGGCEFCVDMVPSAEQTTGGEGWTVTGSPEDGTLTVSPSIKVGLGDELRAYHGFLRNGELTDDCEGRGAPHAEWNSTQLARRTAE